MITSSRLAATRYLHCPIPTHQLPLCLVCISPNCPNPSLLCPQCHRISHSTHQTLSVEKFSRLLEQRRYDGEVPQAANQVLKLIKEWQVDFRREVEGVRERILREIAEFEENVVGELEGDRRDVEGAVSRYGEGVGQQLEYDCGVEPEVLVGNYEKILRGFHQLKTQKSELLEYINGIPAKIKDHISPLLRQLPQITFPYLQSLRKLSIPPIPHLSPPKPSPTYSRQATTHTSLWRFSQSLKHKSLSINNNTLSRTETSLKAAGALIDKVISQGCMWSVLVKKNQGGIWLGIALQSQFKKDGFMPGDWTSEGRGYCLMSTQGRIVTADKSVNWSTVGMRIGEGETVLIEYEAGKLVFMKGEESCEIEVEPPPENDWYRPCVYLWRTTDVVELLHNS